MIDAPKILIIDDEPDIIEFLSYNFKKRGFEVFSANDGIQGLNALESCIPDIIVTDILMPNMNGISMCKQLKSNERFKKIPVVFLSATTDAYQMTCAIEAGGDHYFSKPIKMSVLSERITEILKGKRVF